MVDDMWLSTALIALIAGWVVIGPVLHELWLAGRLRRIAARLGTTGPSSVPWGAIAGAALPLGALVHLAGARNTMGGLKDGVVWTASVVRRHTVWTVLGNKPARREVRVTASVGIGWGAHARGLLDGVATALGREELRLDDLLFDDQVSLHGDERALAAVLTTDLELRVLQWVRGGGTILPGEVSVQVPDSGDDAVVLWIEDAIAFARALAAPDDLRGALIARVRSGEIGPMLRAAAVLGDAVPPDLADGVRQRAWAQLSADHLRVPALRALARLELPRDEVSAGIVPLLRATEWRVQVAAANALARVGTAAALPALGDVRAADDGWPGVNEAIDAAVREIGAAQSPAAAWGTARAS